MIYNFSYSYLLMMSTSPWPSSMEVFSFMHISKISNVGKETNELNISYLPPQAPLYFQYPLIKDEVRHCGAPRHVMYSSSHLCTTQQFEGYSDVLVFTRWAFCHNSMMLQLSDDEKRYTWLIAEILTRRIATNTQASILNFDNYTNISSARQYCLFSIALPEVRFQSKYLKKIFFMPCATSRYR